MKLTPSGFTRSEVTKGIRWSEWYGFKTETVGERTEAWSLDNLFPTTRSNSSLLQIERNECREVKRGIPALGSRIAGSENCQRHRRHPRESRWETLSMAPVLVIAPVFAISVCIRYVNGSFLRPVFSSTACFIDRVIWLCRSRFSFKEDDILRQLSHSIWRWTYSYLNAWYLLVRA